MLGIKPSSLLLVFVLLACGADQQQIVKSFSYDITDNVLTLSLEFNQSIDINTPITIPILSYGNITLTPPSNGKGVILGGTLNLDYLDDGSIANLKKTRLLPNGQTMPPYVTEALGQIRTRENDMIYTDVYLGMDTNHLYLGTALELGYIDMLFPSGITISFTIADNQNRPVGVITIFGPEVQNGTVVSSGGFFFVTNASDLIKYGKQPTVIVPAPIHDEASFRNLVRVNAPYTREYSDPFKIQELLDNMRQAGQEAGYID